MKALVVSKTVTNGGDYLFAKYTGKILEQEYPHVEFVYDPAFRQFTREEMNEYNFVIIAGGPLYDNRLLTYQYFPFLSQAFSLDIPIMVLGGGVYGKTGAYKDIYSYKFSDEALEILQTIEIKGGLLGCRDFVSMEVLKSNGISNVIMTGCPVWYEEKYMDVFNPIVSGTNPSKIIISDPGVTKEAQEQEARATQACQVIEYIKNRFPGSTVEFTFNNGIRTKYSTKCNEIIKKYLEQYNLRWYNLEKNADLFSVYDNAELHIGFRVHSHLYCMAHRIPSLLIEEDRRGFGMDDVLGLSHIYGYDETEWNSKGFQPNEYLIPQLEFAIGRMFSTEYMEMKEAYRKMAFYYENGLKKALKKVLG